MALNSLLDITLAVSEPAELTAFWERRGMEGTDGTLGTPDRPTQLGVVEGAYRHLAELHLGCESEQDLAEIAARLDGLGVDSAITDTRLVCDDPVFDHQVVVDVVGNAPLTPAPDRVPNPPGARNRVNARADAVVEASPRPPRRLGHIVLGTPHLAEANAFYIDGLGYKVSDKILDGVATFSRIESDHHNLLIHPGPTSYLNHYAFEMDDVDAIGKAGQAVVDERSEASVVGIGRHVLGSNIFWYLFDPSGTMFEFFSDLDQIVDDEVWDRDHRRDDWSPEEAGFSVWGPKDPEIFFNPPDMKDLAAAREALGKK